MPYGHTSGFRRPFASDWLTEHAGDLPDREWVAADDSGLVAHDPTMDGLERKLHALHKSMGEVVVSYVQQGAI
jgi:hypothetical protein